MTCSRNSSGFVDCLVIRGLFLLFMGFLSFIFLLCILKVLEGVGGK